MRKLFKAVTGLMAILTVGALAIMPVQANVIPVHSLGYWRTHNTYANVPALQDSWPVVEDVQLCGLTYYEIITLLVSPIVLSVNSTTVETVEVPERQENVLAVYLEQGETMSCSLSMVNSSYIFVEVMGPSGNIIEDLDIIHQGKTFDFTADNSGAYTLIFSHNKNNDVILTVSYDVSAGIEEVTNTVILIGMAIFLILVVSIVFVYWRRRKNRT